MAGQPPRDQIIALPADPGSFGQAVAELRRSKGLTQKEVVARVSNYYSDESTYRRVEQGRRTPDRDAAIAILATGLMLRDVPAINCMIRLLGYNALTAEEIRRLGLNLPVEKSSTEVVTHQPTTDVWQRLTGPSQARITLGIVVLGSFVLTGWIASVAGDAAFLLAASSLYAGLYVVSLFLETAYARERARVTEPAAIVFCFMLLTSAGALALDAWLVRAGQAFALFLSLSIFVLAAILQWVAVRPVLPDSAIVMITRFQSHTAQAAHLKNSVYFLLIVFLFWVPPTHCIAILRQQVRLGHSDSVRELLGHSVLIAKGVVCLNTAWLWGILLAMIVAAIGMGAHLLENLKIHPRLNIYNTLLYFRALLYFCLAFLCLGWYTYSLGLLAD